jgi:guanosine-3',5'-bis(diphosphate) 3'-pyrophosphohydrolase
LYLFESLKTSITGYLVQEQVDQIQLAYLVARDAHQGQVRSSGESYITHPVAVACILAEMHLDYQTIMAALLHDVVEDTPVTVADLEERFGAHVALLVDGVSKLDKLKFKNRKEAHAENFRKMVLAMVQDIRVILIKLADRTHNMRTLQSLKPEKRRRIARETLDIYAPIANRLGIHNIKNELEELGFLAFYPMRYRVLKKVIAKAKGNRQELTQNIQESIHTHLHELGIQAHVIGREKNLYSIYKKMLNKDIQYQDVMDIYAFRVLVDNYDTCYRALGVMHGLYKPRPGRFKDYIAIPKTNGYQSLHTSLMGPRGVPIEVQIRTVDMDTMADQGVAAHWSYKDGQKQGESTTSQQRAKKWMQTLLELQQSAGSSHEFVENVKSDLFPDEIYVFTPNGKILELPVGATPVDFAYHVHTDVGHTCVGARVDRQAYPLSQPLISGQTVEIMTVKGARPNATWMNFVVTGKARSRIRNMLKSLKNHDAVNLGRRLLNHALMPYKIDDFSEEKLNNLVVETHHNSLDDLLVNIGLGNMMSMLIAQKLLDQGDKALISSTQALSVKGTEGMLVSFAKCCRPIAGDSIVAYVSPGKGLVIHMESCSNIRGYGKEPNKYLPVQWQAMTTGADFQTNLRIELMNHQGALAKITKIIADSHANIHSLSTEEKTGRIYLIHLLIGVQNRDHLAFIIKKMKILSEILKVSRTKS